MATKGRNTSVWRTQPDGPVQINWEHRRAEGLVFFAPLSPAHGTLDLVSDQLGTRTGLETFSSTSGAYHSHFGTSNYADFVVPPEIGPTTPFSVAWTQDAIATSAYSTILRVNFGTAGTHKGFVIYQSASDANYYLCFGPQNGTAGGTPLYAGGGAVTNGRRDRFCLTLPNGSQNTASASLSRNGENVSSSGSTTLGNVTTAGFRIGALDTAGDPWEGLIGDFRIWSRALNDTEKEAESIFEESLLLYAPRRIWVPVSAGGGTFKAAWASQRSGIVGSGVRK